MIVIGVDLGTTNSSVYYIDAAGNPVLVRDEKDRSIFPSAVWCAGNGKERVVAHRAKARMGHQPPPVIAVKRKMGTDEKVMLGGVPTDPPEVSAEILIFLRDLVEKAAGDKVGAVVVTVPAYFDIAPRRDTQLAAVKAFFGGNESAAKGKLELQLEPEAAAYAYTAVDKSERLRVLVYDLGGGTFDVTVLEKTPEMGLSAMKFGGDPHLGGDNFDDRLALWILYLLLGGKPEALRRILTSGAYSPDVCYMVLQQLLSNDVAGLRGVLRREDQDLLIPKPSKYDLNLDYSNPEDLGRIQKLKALAEDAKKGLTSYTEVAVVLQSAFSDHSGDLVDINLTLGRAEFDLLVGDMIAKTVAETAAVVEKSGFKPSDFDRVLLVGGSSRMLIVASELRKMFSCQVELSDPDLIVARGAAMRARFIPIGGSAGDGPLALEYPRQTSDRRINITARLSQTVEDGQAYLTRSDGKETNSAVDKDRFILRGVELEPNRENAFHLEVLDGSENVFAEADLSIAHSAEPPPPQAPPPGGTAKITKHIRFLGKRGFKELFPEGEPLPATKVEKCYRAGAANWIRIPIYEGEHFLRDLRIEGIDGSVNIGAEIEFRITIEKEYTVRASAVVVSSGHKADIEFQIERIKMPSLQQMGQDKDKVMEEIEDALPAVKDPNKVAQFRRRQRRLEADYTTASRAAEPDSHHLFSLIGAMKKLATEVQGELVFMHPPFDEFEAIIRVCRNKAEQLKDTAKVTKSDVMKKIGSLENAGKGAWEKEDQKEWKPVVDEALELLKAIEQAIDPPIKTPPMAPETMVPLLMNWLDEMSNEVKTKNLNEGFLTEIDEYRGNVRAVDLSDKEAAREALIGIMQEKLRPLEGRIKKVGGATDKDDLPDWR